MTSRQSTHKRVLFSSLYTVKNAVVPMNHLKMDVQILKFNERHKEEYVEAHEARMRRYWFLRKLRDYAEDGKIAVIESGRDCDGVEYNGHVTILDANKKTVEEWVDSQLASADGPMHFALERPSVAKGIEYTSRDRTLEAFEDGHPGTIYSNY